MVHATAAQSLEGRRLRVGMVGGGREAFIGAVHRMAMRLDDLIVLTAGALSSDPENARLSGADLGLAPDRVYSHYLEMAAKEAARAADLPALELVHRPTPSPVNPLGVKGCGEAGAAGACPAVMNALADALWAAGVRKIDMPATPERVWQALQTAA